jgi:hypothetical protein
VGGSSIPAEAANGQTVANVNLCTDNTMVGTARTLGRTRTRAHTREPKNKPTNKQTKKQNKKAKQSKTKQIKTK